MHQDLREERGLLHSLTAWLSEGDLAEPESGLI